MAPSDVVHLAGGTPLVAESSAKATGDYSLISRDDGKRQWAYKGKPLYRWYNDRRGEGLRKRCNALFSRYALALQCTSLGSLMTLHAADRPLRSYADLAGTDPRVKA